MGKFVLQLLKVVVFFEQYVYILVLFIVGVDYIDVLILYFMGFYLSIDILFLSLDGVSFCIGSY